MVVAEMILLKNCNKCLLSPVLNPLNLKAYMYLDMEIAFISVLPHGTPDKADMCLFEIPCHI